MTGTRPRRLAILAHYDPLGEVGPATSILLDEIADQFSDILIVSTGLSEPARAHLSERAIVIVRPNHGYDFYSWRVGIDWARRTLDLAAFEAVAVVNDSVFPLRRGVLASAFAAAQDIECDLWGLVASHQIADHLQSFFIVFRRSAVLSPWFHRFWSTVWECGGRTFVISEYELTLTTTARQAGLRAVGLFDLRQIEGIKAADGGLNPTHFHWRAVAERVGIVKADIVRANPYGFDLGRLPAMADPGHWAAIEAQARRPRPLAATAGPSPLSEAVDHSQASPATIAVHLHLHYIELLDEIVAQVRNIVVPVDLFVTTTTTTELAWVVQRVKTFHPSARVIPVDNRGRDIAPFLLLLSSGVFSRYRAVCKIHSKRSDYSEHGALWRKALVRPLLGSSRDVLAILAAFDRRPDLGLVVPEASFVRDTRHWGDNRRRVAALAARIDARFRDPPLAFPAGSMYWFRPCALLPLARLGLSGDDFEPEAGARDGTMAHVVERLVAMACWAGGFDIATTDRLDERLAAEGADEAVIPVL